MMRIPIAAAARAGAAAGVLLLLAGCQSLDRGGYGLPEDDTPGAPADPPAEAGAPVLQIDVSGGFVPVGWDFQAVPQLTIYEDGRAIVHGPQILIYPGPALPNLQVSNADVDAVVAAAREAGLLEIPDYGQPMIADLPTTFVTLTVNGQTYRHAANALDLEPGSSDLGLTDTQMAARATLAEFVTAAHDLVDPDSEPLTIGAFGILAWPAAEAIDPELEPQVLPWPLDLALADATECTLVEGSDAEALLDTLAEANQNTQFTQDGVTYDVFFRPLLPHESDCADLA
jgi:hypothetical protein